MTTQDEILEVPIQHLLEEADRRAREEGELQYTMRGLRAQQAGKLGELIGEEHLQRCNVSYEPHFTTEYDVVFLNGQESEKLEFKTKERTVAPREEYDCTAPAYNKDFQVVDRYMFISLVSTDRKSEDINRFTRGFILGSIHKEAFEQSSKLWTTADTDWSNGWKPTVDCWNVLVRDLQPPFQYVSTH